jgi:hypothetical protein
MGFTRIFLKFNSITSLTLPMFFVASVFSYFRERFGAWCVGLVALLDFLALVCVVAKNTNVPP